MPTIDRLCLLIAVVFWLGGMLLGEHMGRTGDHLQHVTHAHIMLVGGVLTFLYGLAYRAWPAMQAGWISKAQLGLHIAGAIGFAVFLYLLYGAVVGEEVAGPALGISSIAVILSVVLFGYLVLFRAGRSA